MLLLTSINDKLQVVTTAAAQLDVHASWVDNAAGTITPGRTNTSISTATTTDVVGPPGASTQRNVKVLLLRNRNSISNTVTVKHTDGTTPAELITAVLDTGEELHYIDGVGFQVYYASGAVKVGYASVDVLTSPTQLVDLSLDAMEVEAATRAARFVLRPQDYRLLGSYRVAGDTTLLSASTAQTDKPWAWMSWLTVGSMAVIKRVRVSRAIGAVNTQTAGLENMKLFKFFASLSIPGGGTQLSPGIGSKKRATMEDSAAYINVNGNMSLPALIGDTNPFAALESGIQNVSGQTTFNDDLFRAKLGELPFCIGCYDGFYVSYSSPASTSQQMINVVTIDWDEYMCLTELGDVG